MQATCAAETDSLGLSEALLKRFDVPGPRYTSYPTADRFVDTFGPAQYRQALHMRSADAPLSLYVHIPFCASVCYYCACNKVITKHHERSAEYLDALEVEMDLQTALSGRGRKVTQMHLGGGTPTFLSDPELTRLMRSLRARFTIEPGAECSIEVDPRT
ncbi:MAG: radical SAM protein, partial [Burkholderiaceae bacterium]